MANPNIDVLGPPPSYDSVVYGSDGGSGPVPTGSNIPPPQYPHSTGPSDYPTPTAPYTYPVPPSYPVQPGYAGGPPGQPQYPTAYDTSSQAQRTTIVSANQPSRGPSKAVCHQIACYVILGVVFVVIVSIIWTVLSG